MVAVARYELHQRPVLAVARYLKVQLAPETMMASSTTLGAMGTTARRALTQNLNICAPIAHARLGAAEWQGLKP